MDFTNTSKAYLQPHIRLRYNINPFWTSSASFDVNHQFVGRSPYQNEAGGWNNLWNAFAQRPLRSIQSAFDVSYTKFGWLFNAEIYYADVRNAPLT